MNPEQQMMQERLAKIEKLKENGIMPYPYSFDKKHDAKMLHEKFANLKSGEHTGNKVIVAGRLLGFRTMGGAAFAHILDNTGRIQLYFKKDNLKQKFKLLKLFDIGDFIGVQGVIFRTKRGELSVEVKKFEMLSKSLRTLPEKWHGLQDTEIRFRKRYLDLVSNSEVKEIFVKRARIIALVREFLDKKGFIEVDIPALQPVYGGAKARPFKTHINAWKMDLYLSISPELYLKRLLVGGFEKVYTICKNFRNEGVDRTHNPEFTMLECYWAYKDYRDMMELAEDIFVYVTEKMFGSTQIKYQGKVLDFRKPWQRISMIDAIKKYAKINVREMDDKALKKLMADYKVKYEGNFNRGLAIEAIFEALVEDKLIQPTFITDHPRETSPLCKPKRENPELIERFEPYCMGWELGNAYSELNDPELQRKLLEEQKKDIDAHKMDEDFLTAMEHGMPPAGGLGFGMDRMVMLLTNAKSIRDVIAFPTMKPETDI